MSGGFDSGHGSSLDRSYNPGTALHRGQYYYNVPAPNRSGDYHHGGSGSSHHHTREPSGLLDLANREQRGSAFELYKKPSNALHHYLDNNLRSVCTLRNLSQLLRWGEGIQGFSFEIVVFKFETHRSYHIPAVRFGEIRTSWTSHFYYVNVSFWVKEDYVAGHVTHMGKRRCVQSFW
jgi:hypothetical protein